jgi:hypothetical protein
LLFTEPETRADDSKQYLYLDPGRPLRFAVSIWDASVSDGTVTHQTSAICFLQGFLLLGVRSARRADVGGATLLDGDRAFRGRSRRLLSR